MSQPLDAGDVRRRAAIVGVTLDDLRIESVVRLTSTTHEGLPAAVETAAFEDEPSSFQAALVRGVRIHGVRK